MGKFFTFRWAQRLDDGLRSLQVGVERDADPMVGVEMASTGEVGCFGDDLHEALRKF